MIGSRLSLGGRRLAFATAQTRLTSSAKLTIAKNILTLREIAHAHDGKGLTGASQNVDVANIPAELDWLGAYTSATVADAQGFKEDPSAWQNKDTLAFVLEEGARRDMWPFTVCGIITYLLLGVLIPLSFPNSARKDSKYISMLEGRHGKLAHDDHGHHAAAAHTAGGH